MLCKVFLIWTKKLTLQQTFQEFIYEKIVIFSARGSLLLTTNFHGIKQGLPSQDKAFKGSWSILRVPRFPSILYHLIWFHFILTRSTKPPNSPIPPRKAIDLFTIVISTGFFFENDKPKKWISSCSVQSRANQPIVLVDGRRKKLYFHDGFSTLVCIGEQY